MQPAPVWQGDADLEGPSSAVGGAGVDVDDAAGHVDRLERAGFLERIRSSEDRRRVGLRLTEDGERLLRRVKARRTTWLEERLRELDSDELAAVDAAIPALRRLLGDDA